jgi:hypothetical protein
LKELESKFVRLDGKTLTEKQKKELLKKDEAKNKNENEDFDPRLHRLTHGIRNNYKADGPTFGGKGTKLN